MPDQICRPVRQKVARIKVQHEVLVVVHLFTTYFENIVRI
jgi:hypothetical protein